MTHFRRMEWSTETNSEWARMFRLAERYFEAAIMNICKELKENMLTVNQKIGNLSRETETIFFKRTKWKFYG